jgi:acyl-CoA synthetase (AMP-forming)/AMP-acid ligase II
VFFFKCFSIVVGTETVLVEGNSKEFTIFDESGAKEFSGDLQIQGPNVFKGYFGRPEATLKEFTQVTNNSIYDNQKLENSISDLRYKSSNKGRT